MTIPGTSWLQYLSARRSQARCISAEAAAQWEAEAHARLDKHFTAVDMAAFAADPKPWVWRNEADHRPINPARWPGTRRKPAH